MAMITINANTEAIAAQGGIDFEAYIRGGFVADTTGGGFPTFDGSGAFAGEEMLIGYGTEATSKYVSAHGELEYNFATHTVAGTINTIEYGTRGEGSYDENGYFVGGNVELTITGLDLNNPVPTTPEEEAEIEENGPVHNFAVAHMYGADAEQHDLDTYADSLDAYAQHFIGSTGNDIYSGTSHNDVVEGNDGNDTVVFSGNQADYTLLKEADGTVTVVDNRTGEVTDGIDKLTGVETLQFADGTASTADIDAHGMITIDAHNVGGQLDGINFNTFLADYFAALSSGSYKFYGGTPDSFYGGTYYMNGDQVAFQYKEGETDTSDRFLFGGEDFAYDFIHYGASYGHGISGTLDSWTFGQWVDGTTGTQGTGEAGLIQGLLEALKITGFDLTVAPGTGSTGNALSDIFNAAQAGDVAALYAFLGGYAQHFIGTDGNDTYTGTVLGDIIEGGLGDDVMAGGAGDDTYYVDSSSDVVTELEDFGTDEVFVEGTDFKLGANVEILRATGDVGHKLLGNALDNEIYGTSGDDVLNGGGGADVLEGGQGNDTYVVDSAGDAVTDTGGSSDVLKATVDFALADSLRIETLRAQGTDGISLTGNQFANSIFGGTGDDALAGGLGRDFLKGGDGEDSFLFDTALGIGNVDQIGAFSVADDTVHLDTDLFGIAEGTLKAKSFVIGKSAQDANDHIIYNAKTGALFYDADGDGDGEAVKFATLNKHLDLTNHDFFGV